MKEINSLLNEYKVLTSLVAEVAGDPSKAQAIANANQRISTITRKLHNLGISPTQISRLVTA